MSIFFKRRKIIAFEILTFDFHIEKKKASVNYYLQKCKHMVMKKIKELLYLPPNICALLVNLFATLQQSNSSAEEEMVKY